MVKLIHCAVVCYVLLGIGWHRFHGYSRPSIMKREAGFTEDGRPGLLPYIPAFRPTRCRSPPRLSLPSPHAQQRKEQIHVKAVFHHG